MKEIQDIPNNKSLAGYLKVKFWINLDFSSQISFKNYGIRFVF